jgi:hypothetical protein
MKFNGKGLLELADKSRYDGYFLNGMKNGPGVFTYPNGD